VDIFLIVCLTSLSVFSIIVSMKKSKEKMQYSISKQSDMHIILKNFFSREIANNEKSSQILQRKNDRSVKVVIIEDQAYWVENSIFYTSGLIDGRPNVSEALPVDIYNMPKKDLDKMLFILDNLGGSNNNERGSSRNE